MFFVAVPVTELTVPKSREAVEDESVVARVTLTFEKVLLSVHPVFALV